VENHEDNKQPEQDVHKKKENGSGNEAVMEFCKKCNYFTPHYHGCCKGKRHGREEIEFV